jgi:hypothetical protein
MVVAWGYQRHWGSHRSLSGLSSGRAIRRTSGIQQSLPRMPLKQGERQPAWALAFWRFGTQGRAFPISDAMKTSDLTWDEGTG